ncbi:hypothetical protein DRP04_02135 [Archaeoglobales archaeon]|nr:MAG: hypothetical protein DRP04_02135 [Archaeoglobales archaeon]
MLITVCDICGGREKVNRRWYPFDRKMSVAGDSETVGEVFDLCESCELAVLREVLGLERNANMWDTNKRIISKVKEKIEFKKEVKK